MRDRKWHLRIWRNCFVGEDAVDWMCHHFNCSRADAIALGQRVSSFFQPFLDVDTLCVLCCVAWRGVACCVVWGGVCA